MIATEREHTGQFAKALCDGADRSRCDAAGKRLLAFLFVDDGSAVVLLAFF